MPLPITAEIHARLCIERQTRKAAHLFAIRLIWTMVASCVLMLLGLIMLLGGLPLLWLTILVYGGGYGIMWIARGTLPLALFGPQRYATLMGRLAFPSLIVQALAPSAGALLIERQGVEPTMAVLTGFAALNVVLIAALWALCRPHIVRE